MAQLSEVPQVLGEAFAAAGPPADAKQRQGDHVARLQHLFGAIAAGAMDELREHLTEDVTFHIAAPEEFPWTLEARGPDAVTAAIARNFRALQDQRPEVLSVVAEGDTVMLTGREQGRWAETGEPYEGLVAQHFTFRDGRIAAFRSVVSRVDRAADGG